MKILIAVYSDVPFWNLPASHVERLGRAFPGVEFVHAPDAVAAVRLIPGAEGAYAYQIHRLSLPRHRTCTACGPTASGTALARNGESSGGAYKMADELKGKTVVVLAADGFEQVELLEPRKALEQAGATVHVASLKRGPVKGWHATEWGEIVEADRSVDEIAPAQYDALLLPGGVMNPDKLRMSDAAVGFVRSFFNAHKPVAAICHGPWLLAEAAVIKGYTMTSYPSIKTDLKNAGATWVDEQVVVDRGLVTSRKPDDIPAFNRKMIEEFAEGPHTEAARRERDLTAGRR